MRKVKLLLTAIFFALGFHAMAQDLPYPSDNANENAAHKRLNDAVADYLREAKDPKTIATKKIAATKSALWLKYEAKLCESFSDFSAKQTSCLSKALTAVEEPSRKLELACDAHHPGSSANQCGRQSKEYTQAINDYEQSAQGLVKNSGQTYFVNDAVVVPGLKDLGTSAVKKANVIDRVSDLGMGFAPEANGER